MTCSALLDEQADANQKGLGELIPQKSIERFAMDPP